jgi:hypothetical protein
MIELIFCNGFMFVKIKSFVDSIAAKTLLITAGTVTHHAHYLNDSKYDGRVRTTWIVTARPSLLVFPTLFADNGWPLEHRRDHDELLDILKVKVLHLS